jgi:hypothetical protein
MVVCCFLQANVFISSFDYQLIIFFNTSDFMVFGSEPREGIDPKSPIKDVSKSRFLDLDEKEIENVNKGDGRFNNHVELKQKMCLMNGNFS